MPSLFARARTQSTSKKAFLSPSDAPDEFGRVSSRDSSPTPKKDKKKAKDTRAHTVHDLSRGTPSPFPLYAEGAFLPLSLEPPRNGEAGELRPRLYDYGFLSYERHVVLAPDQLINLLTVLVDELSARGGITTPFIFSTTALDVSYSSIKRLVRAFLDTCDMRSSPSVEKAEAKWRDEARFAGLHELGMCLRWGLARVVRVSGGREVHGLIAWDHYVKFRESEAAKRYPPGYFQTFLEDLSPTIQSIVTTVLTLLVRLTANSTSSGHTPPTLSPLFGPLFFGLGPASLSFHHTYLHYLRATNAMEHIILAFIRWQDTPRSGPSRGASAALGVPARLKDWIKGYPAMLPILNDPKKDTAPPSRKGARTVRLLNVRRNVRMYTRDLVKIAATWGSRTAPRTSPGPSNALYTSKEWERVAPVTLKLAPKYSESFKKRMNMPPNFNPESGPGYGAGILASTSSTSSYKSAVSSVNSATSSDSDFLGLNREREDRFRSLTDLKWGEFESMGFSEIDDEKKLQFDLTESARQERSRKRQTLSWNDFSAAGFSRTDVPLSATLQFSSPISNTISSWPSQKAEISKKLKKAEKALPHFGWDTEPVVFNEELIEEAFIDVFCDLIYGSGWMDNERCEEVDRDSNWAMVEFKATPPSTSTVSGGSDPRTSTSLVLFEEFVPLEYRQKLAQSSSTRRKLPSLFLSPKSKQWKPAATLNGKPYVVGHVPRSPSYREVEFEGLLHGDSTTKVISLAAPAPRVSSMMSPTGIDFLNSPRSDKFILPPLPAKHESTPLAPLPPPPPPPPKSDEQHSMSYSTESSVSSVKRLSRFRLPATVPVPSPSVRRKSGIPPAQYSIVEFETRLASYSDDEYNNANETESAKQRRRQSKDDAWVDILVGDKGKGMLDSDGLVGAGDGGKRRSLRGAHSDPDLASMEVAQVLAAVKNRSLSPPSMVGRVDRDYGMDMDQHVRDLDISEIETVPRTSDATSTRYSEPGENADVEDSDNEHEGEEDGEGEGEDGDKSELKEAVIKAKMKARRGRPGYFDLHPERRRPHSGDIDIEEELRAKLARDDSDDEDQPELEPEPKRNLPDAPQDKTPVQEGFPYKDLHLQVQQANGDATDNINADVTRPAVPQSKTAALIEMYRERERMGNANPNPTVPQVVTIPPAPEQAPLPVLPPSRIPVKPKEQVPVPVLLPPTTEREPQLEVDTTMMQVTLEEFERLSPGRYIHGAPLHNVLEEEEEED
ncbi:hypothetical protein AX15_007381 [Amanita polypyramis BW_CC]|nr:hypothetical protein AX15_007381 [Amanita polypyramis BW_CC]